MTRQPHHEGEEVNEVPTRDHETDRDGVLECAVDLITEQQRLISTLNAALHERRDLSSERRIAEQQDEITYLRQLVKTWRNVVKELRRDLAASGTCDLQTIDGDLVAEVIADSCPAVLSDEAARSVAEGTLAALSHIDGVTVVRGADGLPWTPDPIAEAHTCCEHAP